MYSSFKVTDIPRAPEGQCVRSFLSREACRNVSRYHQSYPQYTQTPLVRLEETAARFGLKGLYVKGESYRFGLNAFNVQGGS